MANLVQHRSSLQVRGGEYPIPEYKARIATYISYVQLGIVGFLMAGNDQYLPVQVRDNKLVAGIVIWLLGNAVSSSVKNSGAFEIFLGQTKVWSTLEQGRLPTYPELIAAFHQQGINLEG